MVELVRVVESLPQGLPILYVGTVAADARVENIRERILPEEQVADDAHTPPYLLVCP